MKRILIADDEPHVVRILRLTLEREGYQVHIVPNGEEAFAVIQGGEPIDILVTDIDMPRMTGQELCVKISEEIPDRKFLIFVVTSKTDIEHREWSQKIDNLMFLEKPISIHNLVGKLKAYFEENNS